MAIIGSILFSAKAVIVKLAYRYGVDAATLIALRMAVLCPFRRSSMGRYVHRAFTRSESLDLPTIVPATACH